MLFLIGYTVADEEEIRAVGGDEYDIDHLVEAQLVEKRLRPSDLSRPRANDTELLEYYALTAKGAKAAGLDARMLDAY